MKEQIQQIRDTLTSGLEGYEKVLMDAELMELYRTAYEQGRTHERVFGE